MIDQPPDFFAGILPTLERMSVVLGGILGAAFLFLFGDGVGTLLFWLLALAVADFATGYAAALIRGELASTVCHRGCAKKIFMFGVVAIAHGLDVIFAATFSGMLDGVGLQWGAVMETMAISAYGIGEATSIIENVELLGIKTNPIVKHTIKAAEHRLEHLAETVEGKAHHHGDEEKDA